MMPPRSLSPGSQRNSCPGMLIGDRHRRARLSQVLDLLAEDNRLNVYAGKLEVRPPGAPTTPGRIEGNAAVGKPLRLLKTFRFGRTVVLSEAAASVANAEGPSVGRPRRRRNDSAERLTVYAENQIPSQINSNQLANDSQTAECRQPQASLARDEHG